MNEHAVFTLFSPVTDREDWLRWRRERVGASDVGAILGMSQWATPMTVYLDKQGLLDDQEPTRRMRLGQTLEPMILDEFTQETGLFVRDEQAAVFDSEHPWRACTLDALAVESPNSAREDAVGTVQVKTTRERPWDVLPNNYALQVMYEMGIVGLAHAWVPVWHGLDAFAVYEVDFDAGMFDTICRIVDSFWRDNVLAENPPPVDSSDATSEAIKDAFRDRAHDASVLVDETLAVEWLAAKKAVTEADAWKKRVESTIRLTLGEATLGTDGQGNELVTWKSQNGAAPFDMDGLRADHPELARKYTGDKPTVRVLRATKTLKALAGAAPDPESW